MRPSREMAMIFPSGPVLNRSQAHRWPTDDTGGGNATSVGLAYDVPEMITRLDADAEVALWLSLRSVYARCRRDPAWTERIDARLAQIDPHVCVG